MPEELDKKTRVMLNTLTLHAELLGARRQKEEMEAEVGRNIQQAKAVYEAAVNAEKERLTEAQGKIDKAIIALHNAQAAALRDHNMVIDLEPQRSGGFTKV